MAKPRPKVPPDTESALLWACDNTCSMCTNERLPPYVIHHMDGNPNNNSIDNLIALCLTCHALAESRSTTARYPKGQTLKELKAKWEGIVLQRRKLQALPRGMMMRESQEPSGRTTREFLWQASYVNGRADEAIEAAKKIEPEAMECEEGRLAQDFAKHPDDKEKARKVARLLKRKPSKRRLTKEERVRRYSLNMVMGQFHFDRQEYANAIKCCQAAHGQAEKLRNPDLIFLSLFDLGAAYGMLGDYAQASGLFKRAIELRPKEAKAHYNLGVALEQKGDTEGEIAAYREAIRIKLDYAEAHYSLGVALGEKGDTEEEIAEYRKAIQLKSDYAEAHSNLGVALQQKGDIEGAIAEYRKAVGIRPRFAEAHSNLGVALFKAGRYEDGIAALERAIGLRKSLPDLGRRAYLNFVDISIARATVLLGAKNTRRASRLLGKIRALYLQTKGADDFREADIHKAISYELTNLLGRLMVQDHEMGAKMLRLLRLPEVEKTLTDGRYLREIAILRDMLVAAYAPEKIIVYGSCAAGDVSAGSDIDLLIIKEGVEGKNLIDRKLELMKLIGAIKPGIKIEAVVHTSRELEEKLKSSWFYRDEIMAKGWVIYEKRR